MVETARMPGGDADLLGDLVERHSAFPKAMHRNQSVNRRAHLGVIANLLGESELPFSPLTRPKHDLHHGRPCLVQLRTRQALRRPLPAMRRLDSAQLVAGNKVGAVRSAPGPEPAIADPQAKRLDVAPKLARSGVEPHQVEGFSDGHEEGFSQIQGPMDMTS